MKFSINPADILNVGSATCRRIVPNGVPKRPAEGGQQPLVFVEDGLLQRSSTHGQLTPIADAEVTPFREIAALRLDDPAESPPASPAPSNSGAAVVAAKRPAVSSVEARPSATPPAATPPRTPVRTPQSTPQVTPQLSPQKTNGVAERRTPQLSDAANSPVRSPNSLLERKRQLKDDDELYAFSWTSSDLSRLVKNHGPGLLNVGNDCFMNSVLQFFIHTPQLVRYVRTSRNNHPCSNICMHCALNIHVENVLRGMGTISPKVIRQVVNAQFPNRIPHNQEDAHEMLLFMLGKLEPPLPKKKAIRENGDSNQPPPLTEMDRIFGGKMKSLLTCGQCSNRRGQPEMVRELNLSFPPNSGYATCDLKDMLKHFFASERMTGYKCENCHQVGTTRRWFILQAPNILIIQLKRFRPNSSKLQNEVKVPLGLDLAEFASNKAPPANYQYRLYGYISHYGSSIHSGHYVARMRGFNDKWYKFDDSEVSDWKGGTYFGKDPYILFYHKWDKSMQFNGNSPAHSVNGRSCNGPTPAKRPFQGAGLHKTSPYVSPLVPRNVMPEWRRM
ncbi:putative ubiquitin carboxyl-terminal hydrolase 16 [Aphelenchoides fujianensis]|nr:putative ubiquitin carboxyl-terminal hydrolase 16 [Aphelenchoides fujianensis]